MKKFRVWQNIQSHLILEDIEADNELDARKKAVEIWVKMPDEDFNKEIISNYESEDTFAEEQDD